MQNERGMRDPFSMFGGPGSFGGFGGSIFGRDPSDDPFFTRPFGSIFDQSNPVRRSLPANPQNEPIIRELGSDDEEEMENKGRGGQKSASANNEPFVDHPDDEADDMSGKQTNRWTDYNRAQGSQPQTFKVHSCKVSYGGIDGVYYTSSATRKMGSDGVVMEECKEADKRTGEAAHRISRGLHNKGHSVTRKLNCDGKVDTLQTLHNLNEDELGSFEEAWNGNFRSHLPSWTGSSSTGVDRISNRGGSLLPSARHIGDGGGRVPTNVNRGNSSSGRPRNVVRIPIE